MRGKMGGTKISSGGGNLNVGSINSAASDANSTSSAAAAETRIKDLLKELYRLIHQVQV